MKKTFFITGMVCAVAVSVQAELVRFGSARVKSVTDTSMLASSVAMLAEQPMYGMMAGGMIQAMVAQKFGSVDPSKPFGALAYMKTPLPDWDEVFEGGDDAIATVFEEKLTYAVVAPVQPGSPDAYLAQFQAVDLGSGVYKVENELPICYLGMSVFAQGYVVLASDVETAQQAAKDMQTAIKPRLDNMSLEVVIEKPAFAAYANLFNQFEAQTDLIPEEKMFGDMSKFFNEYQSASLDMARKIYAQANELSVGVACTTSKGVTFDLGFEFDEGSEFAKSYSRAKPVNPTLFGMIPPKSDFYVVYSNLSAMGFTETYVDSMFKPLASMIENIAVRAKVVAALDTIPAMFDSIAGGVAYVDYDSKGHLVAVEKTQVTDLPAYYDGSKKWYDAFQVALDEYAPGQEFIQFNQHTQPVTTTIDYGKLIDFIGEETEEPVDAESREKILELADAIMGRTYVCDGVVKGSVVTSFGRASDSDYRINPNHGPTIANRMRSLQHSTIIEQPCMAMGISYAGLIKHFGSRVMAAIPEKIPVGDKATFFEGLPASGAGGICMLYWAQPNGIYQRMNFSSSELRGFIKFVTRLSTLSGGIESGI